MTETKPATVEVLRELPTFEALSDEQLRRLASITTMREVVAQEDLLRQGRPAGDLYIVATGKFSLCIDLGGGKESCFMTATRGEVLGWSALLEQPTWLASATAIKPSIVVAMSGDDLRAVCESDHELGYYVMRNLFAAVTARLHDTRVQLLDMYGNA